MNIKNIIYLLIVYTLIITSILLFLRKKKHVSIILLGLYSAFQVICVGSYFLYINFDYWFTYFPQLLFAPRPFMFIIIPLFFLYITSSIYPQQRFKKEWYFHFLPFAVILFYYVIFYWVKPGYYLRDLFQYQNKLLLKEFIISNLFFNAQYLIYCVLLLRLLIGINKNRNKLFHTVFNEYLLRVTIYMYIAGCILSLTTNILAYFKLNSGFDILFLNSLYFYFFFIYLFYITVKGFNTREIFKYNVNNFDVSNIELLYIRILSDLEINNTYLEPTITLKNYAELLNEDWRLVSQAINHGFGSNFSDFMNHHRIELSKKILLDMPDLNVQEVMYKTGFNSKATFNKVFKNLTGITPSEFRSSKFGTREV